MDEAERADEEPESAPPRFELEQGGGRHLLVVGRAPHNESYIWIGSDARGCFGTIHMNDLRALRDAINDALDTAGRKRGSKSCDGDRRSTTREDQP